MSLFSDEDYNFANSLGISASALDQQWKRLTSGFKRIELAKAATIGDGIRKLSAFENKKYAGIFDQEGTNYKIIKFVPASGAASRMFLPFREMIEDPFSDQSELLISSLSKFPFYNALVAKTNEKGLKIKDLISDPKKLADFIIGAEGLDYDKAPKGLIPFSANEKEVLNAFEMHLEEAKQISDSYIHFTVAEDFLVKIKSGLNEERAEYSIQDPSTHFISMHDNEPVRDESGKLIFWPSGHGSLLKNLNELDSDIVFIKNIDNIQIPSKNTISIEVKKILGGYLIDLKQTIDLFLFQLEEDPEVDLEEIKNWIKNTLDPSFDLSNKNDLITYLHRPIRIAGMVLNEGKAGGGPFWIKSESDIGLQIVEGAQIDKSDPIQNAILASSTHFNPVDMVCSIIDHRGVKYDLEEYLDKEAGFLTKKQVNGYDAIIMERPGLWNGSMASWLSVFIEIPLSSFTPVKDVLDLLPTEKEQLS